MGELPVTVIVATLNEEANLSDCLRCIAINRPTEIIVVDAGSLDHTRMIAHKHGVKIVTTDALGLAWQRQVGLSYVESPYVAFVDAQDRLRADCLARLLDELLTHEWHAIQAQVEVCEEKSYWQRAYSFNARLSLNVIGPTNMVGRPCIYVTESIRRIGFDPFFARGVGCEDADVSIRFEIAGLPQGKGSGVSDRRFPDNFAEWFGKWKKYGRGDARLVWKYPHKTFSILRHQLWSYPIERAVRAVRAGGVSYLPFFVLFGWVRFGVLCYEYCRLCLANQFAAAKIKRG